MNKADRQETIVITHRDHSILPNNPDIRDLNLIHPCSSSSSKTPSSSSSRMTSSKSEDRNKTRDDGSTPYFNPSEGYTMATHVIRPPPSSSSSRSGQRGEVEVVYQSTNPCLPIRSDTVLGIARLERYVVPSCFPSSSFLPFGALNQAPLRVASIKGLPS